MIQSDERPMNKEIEFYYKTGAIKYRGSSKNNKPYGAGTVYYESGLVYQEGVFGIKGLLYGREYYPNGHIRFEGVWEINTGYGPNYPIYGTYYDINNNILHNGSLVWSRSGLGWPSSTDPISYNPVVQKNAPNIRYYHFEDESLGDCI